MRHGACCAASPHGAAVLNLISRDKAGIVNSLISIHSMGETRVPCSGESITNRVAVFRADLKSSALSPDHAITAVGGALPPCVQLRPFHRFV
jgi:hypothetical protein